MCQISLHKRISNFGHNVFKQGKASVHLGQTHTTMKQPELNLK